MEVAAAVVLGVAAAVVLGVAAAVVLGVGGVVVVVVAVVVVVVVVLVVVAAVAVVVVVVEVEAEGVVVVIESVFHIGICCGVTGFGYGSGMDRGMDRDTLSGPAFPENGVFLVWSSSTRARQSRNRRNCKHSATIEVQEAVVELDPVLLASKVHLQYC